jgi:glycosyltransferase involved in cell wall biosynthesis
MLRRLEEQERRLDKLVVVDNDPSHESESTVREHEAKGHAVDYIPAQDNLGSIGGFARGVEHVVQFASDEDWILSLDDDDPPFTPSLFRDLLDFGKSLAATDERVGGVALVGARFDWKHGRSVRISDDELVGPVEVDWLGQDQFAMYRVAAVRGTGPYAGHLFFGHGELEYGLRLRKAGYTLYAHGELLRARRAAQDRLGLTVQPSKSLGPVMWRRYYVLRNLIHMMRLHGRRDTALRVSLVQGLGKPLANLPRHPRLALAHLRLNTRAVIDGWRGVVGRTVEPSVRTGPKPPPVTASGTDRNTSHPIQGRSS